MTNGTIKFLVLHSNAKQVQKITTYIRDVCEKSAEKNTIDIKDNFIDAIRLINDYCFDCVFIFEPLINKLQLIELNKLLKKNKSDHAEIIILNNEEDIITLDFLEQIVKNLINKQHNSLDFDQEHQHQHKINKVNKASFMATHDSLTLLPNRILLNESILISIESANINNNLFSVFFIDLDGFKNINDRAGHETGDYVLKEVAKRLLNITRATDIVARQGGDEFIVLLSRIEDKTDAKIVADKILATLASPFYFQGESWQISASIGIAIYPNDGQTTDEIIAHADAAMYEAKSSGKNNAQYYNEELNIRAQKKNAIIAEIKQAVTNDEFEIFLQPQYEIKTGNIFGAETFVRWKHSTKGILLAADFLPQISNTEYINAIGYIVLDKILKLKLPNFLKIAIHVESRQLANNEFVHHLFDLHSQGLDISFLSIEITEDCFKTNLDLTRKRLDKLKSIGATIILDDFGKGISSIRQFTQLPIDIVKIDNKFFQDARSDGSEEKGIIALAHYLDRKVMAKRVENKKELEKLIKYNCDYAQGYCYSEPVTVDKFVENYNPRIPTIPRTGS
ncbi:MAG: EAL domain-containing protein [Gammaproteobacteria bacterium]|nr:EAL domain-containing protein [Gammaproteobacteria bacterium]